MIKKYRAERMFQTIVMKNRKEGKMVKKYRAKQREYTLRNRKEKYRAKQRKYKLCFCVRVWLLKGGVLLLRNRKDDKMVQK